MDTNRTVHAEPRPLPRVERIVGRVRGPTPGPTLLIVGGIHGNEPAGVVALGRLVEGLRSRSVVLRGEVVALAGNRHALERALRYVHKDLNRQWTPEKIDALRGLGPEALRWAEDREQVQLLEVIERILGEARGPAYFIDVHTSSASGCPFVTVGDTLRNRAFARSFPLPLILGLEEQVDGALLEYLNNSGLVTLGVEAGHHTSPSSVDHLEAVLWLALLGTGQLDERDLPEASRLRRLLEEASRGVPTAVEVRERHAITPADGFRMRPGFSNFAPVRAGELLATDSRGEIRAPEDGLVLLPLYQGQGDDGFFFAREVRPFWLRLSNWLRRLGFGAVVPLLPGVRTHPRAEATLVVDTRVARLFPLQILHLLGYRKLRREGPFLVVSRRRFDRDPPLRAPER